MRERCYRCLKPRPSCLCERIPRVENRTAITILQHPRERFHAIGTARIAHLGLAKVLLARPRCVAPRTLAMPPCATEGSGLLFPSPDARDLAELAADERPGGLVVLDGTWSHARRLYEHNPWLAALPHFRLAPAAPTRYRIRKAPRRDYISTIEAIVTALRILEPDTAGLSELLAVFDAMIDEQAAFADRVPRRMEKKERRREAPCRLQ